MQLEEASLKSEKLLQPNGIPVEIRKLVLHLLLGAINGCLKDGIFPYRWKAQDLR